MISWQEELNDNRLAPGGWYGCIAPNGWKDLVLETDAMLAYIDPDYKICQIKEKFGTLRYYYDSEKEFDGIERKIMEAIVYAAESRSGSTCEGCGKWGELRTDKYYIRTLCDGCNSNRE